MARLNPGDDDVSVAHVTLLALFQFHTEGGSDTLDDAAWLQLVHDLLCLRDGTLHVAQDTVLALAGAILSHIHRTAGGADAPRTCDWLIQVATSWDVLLQDPDVAPALAGSPRLPLLHDPALLGLIHRLHELRHATLQVPQPPRGVGWPWYLPTETREEELDRLDTGDGSDQSDACVNVLVLFECYDDEKVCCCVTPPSPVGRPFVAK